MHVLVLCTRCVYLYVCVYDASNFGDFFTLFEIILLLWQLGLINTLAGKTFEKKTKKRHFIRHEKFILGTTFLINIYYPIEVRLKISSLKSDDLIILSDQLEQRNNTSCLVPIISLVISNMPILVEIEPENVNLLVFIWSSHSLTKT